MTVITGPGTTGNVATGVLAVEVASSISLLEPNIQAVTAFTRATKTKETTETNYKWFEEEDKARFDTTSAAVASTTATEIPVTHGLQWAQWDQMLNTRTGEQLRVDSINNNTLTVARGAGAAAMNEGDELLLIGMAQPENDTMKTPRSQLPTSFENQTQIFREPFELSRTAQKVKYQVNPNEWDRKERAAAREHAKNIEYAFLFGKKTSTNPGGAPLRTTGGALSFISTNQMDAGGILSEAEWNAYMALVFRYGTTHKLTYLSSTATLALQKFPASKQVTKNDETTYGMDVTTYEGPFGSIYTVYHRILEGTKYSGYAITLDMENIAYRPLTDSDTKLRPDIQAPSQDGKAAEFLTEAGLEFGEQRTHGVLTGITG